MGSGKSQLLSGEQFELLQLEVTSDISETEWRSYLRSIESAVRRKKQAERIDVFNAHYGLFRGIVPASILLAAATIWLLPENRVPLLILASVFVGSLHRMDRFDKAYARELVHRFLDVPLKDDVGKNPNGDQASL